MKLRHKIIQSFAILGLSVSLFTVPAFAANGFKDVNSKHWASPAINWGVQNKIVSGYSDGTFKPSTNVTGAEFLTMLVRAYNPSDLPQVKAGSKWDDQVWQYATDMNWEISNRSDPIDRGSVASIVANSMGYTCSLDDYVQVLLDTGISSGKYSKTLEGYAPNENLTRAEAIQFIRSVKDKVSELKEKPLTQVINCPGPNGPKDEVTDPVQDPIKEDVQDTSKTALTHGNYSVSSLVTEMSKIQLTAILPVDKAILVVVTKDSYESKEVYYTSDKKLDTFIHLRDGTGVYTMEIYEKDIKDADSAYFTSVLWDDTAFSIKNTDKRDLNFLLPSTYIQSDDADIVALAQNITKGKTTDMEKTKAIHDYTANLIDYDVMAFLNNDAKWYTTKQIIQRRLGVCSDYANVAVALNRAVGIKAKVVVGTTIWADTGETFESTAHKDNHAWVETYIDGKWITQDPTWDAGYVDLGKKQFVRNLTDEYFNPTASNFAKDHRKSYDDNQ